MVDKYLDISAPGRLPDKPQATERHTDSQASDHARIMRLGIPNQQGTAIV